MWLDCKIVAEHESGDHFLVIGQGNAMSPSDWRDGVPLLYFKGKYRHLHALNELAK